LLRKYNKLLFALFLLHFKIIVLASLASYSNISSLHPVLLEVIPQTSKINIQRHRYGEPKGPRWTEKEDETLDELLKEVQNGKKLTLSEIANRMNNMVKNKELPEKRKYTGEMIKHRQQRRRAHDNELCLKEELNHPPPDFRSSGIIAQRVAERDLAENGFQGLAAPDRRSHLPTSGSATIPDLGY
jgi:hypothetical protein